MKEIISTVEFENYLVKEPIVLTYFSHSKCNVCKVLKPKLSAAIKEHFPKIKQLYINIEKHPELTGQQQVFTIPTVLVFFEGKESIRKSRSFGIGELMQELERPYSMLFKRNSL